LIEETSAEKSGMRFHCRWREQDRQGWRTIKQKQPAYARLVSAGN
jgi:hypothetical protein